MQRKLSFEHTPPLSIPLRFFLTAPLFAMLAGALLAWRGTELLTTRWSPLTLALTHLLTLGFLTMVMIGAMIQLLQVVVGIEVPRAQLTATVVHGALVPGTLALAGAFLFSVPVLFQLALLFLTIAFVWLFGAFLVGMWGAGADNVTFKAMRLGLVALGITVTLGTVMSGAWTGNVSLARVSLMQLTNLHAGWGLLGWVGLLVIGVGYQVVPMFLVTPVYPVRVTRYLAVSLFSVLILWTVSKGWSGTIFHITGSVLSVVCAAALALFAVITLRLLWQRKRQVPDTALRFWAVSAGSLLVCSLLWLAGVVRPEIGAMPDVELMLGVVFIIGFGYSAINGMLYKIVPFLIWYHLQTRLADLGIKAPNIRNIIPEVAGSGQFCAHLLALGALVLAVIFPDQLSRMAGALFMVSSLWLWINLLRAAFFYRAALPR